MTQWFHHTLPLILGWDVSGVVEEVGGRVNDFAVGEEVFARPDISRDGAYAEYIAVRAGEVVRKPSSLSHIQAAALPHAALTAWQALFDSAKLAPGQTVLIHGAAGGVGTFAVQLAKWRGAQVIGTASSNNQAFLRQLGVDETIDYTATPLENWVQVADVVLDTVGGETQQRSWGMVKPGGVLVSLVHPPAADMAAAHQVQAHLVAMQPNLDQLKQITELAESGKITPIISTVLPLQEVRQAHMLSESRRTRGKIVLQVAA
jgi:NADPH:quinone reductase-like Zn-dependent oxidoreductase